MRYRLFFSIQMLVALVLSMSWQGPAVATPADPLERESVPSARLATAIMLSVTRAGSRLVAVGERGFIEYSDDDGVTWTQSRSPVSVTLTSVRFITASTGWSVGHGGVVLMTSDGGKTWHKQLDGLQAAGLVKDAAGAVVGSSREAAVRDADRLIREGADKPFFDIWFESETTGLVVGAYGLAFLTRDGGRSWTYVSGLLPNPDGLHLYRIYAEKTAVWIVGERGLFLRANSITGPFAREQLPYGGSLFGAVCTATRVCYVHGLRGNLLKSDEDAHSWSRLDNDLQVTITASTTDNAGNPIFADQAGRMLGFRQDSSALMEKVARRLPPINSLVLANDGSLIAATVNGMARIPRSGIR